MIRLARVSWALLLLLVLGQQCWEAETEVRTLADSVAHSVAHSRAHSVAHTGVHDLVRGEKLIRHYSIGGKLKEMDTEDEDLRSVETEALNLNLNFEGAEGDPVSNSSRADFPCPDYAAIAPCVCTVDADSNIDLNCTFVESEEQLEAVFNQEFPVKEMHGFYMANNSAIRVLTNSHSGVSFERIDLYPGPFAIQAITDYFLVDSRLNLRYLRIENSQLLSDGFPFATLVAMEALDSLTIRYSSLTWIPNIKSPTIRQLRFSHGSVDDIEPGTFDNVTNLDTLDLDYNSMTELRAGTVPIREGPMTFYGYSNYIKVVHPGAFFFSDASSAGSNELLFVNLCCNQLQLLHAGTFPIRAGAVTLYLHLNQIASIEPGTFVLAGASGAASSGTLYIYLYKNLLQSLQTGTFPLRNSPVSIHLYNNQIASIEPGTFVLPEATDSFNLIVFLFGNQLTTFDEDVFGDLMPFITDLRLSDNPLSCGCDIAWLIASPTFMTTVDSDATCADGTNLHDLDPQDYVGFC